MVSYFLSNPLLSSVTLTQLYNLAKSIFPFQICRVNLLYSTSYNPNHLDYKNQKSTHHSHSNNFHAKSVRSNMVTWCNYTFAKPILDNDCPEQRIQRYSLRHEARTIAPGIPFTRINNNLQSYILRYVSISVQHLQVLCIALLLNQHLLILINVPIRVFNICFSCCQLVVFATIKLVNEFTSTPLSVACYRFINEGYQYLIQETKYQALIN